ncbi:MAG: hypothetical protein H6Q90_6782, partial [Deltaproteobacteria bacterium]|nr:hypothetical protein [Deltaproteobacteria bacterium]
IQEGARRDTGTIRARVNDRRFGNTGSAPADRTLALGVDNAPSTLARALVADRRRGRAVVVGGTRPATPDGDVAAERALDQLEVIPGAVAGHGLLAATDGHFGGHARDRDAGHRRPTDRAVDIAERQRRIAARAVGARPWIRGGARASKPEEDHQPGPSPHAPILDQRWVRRRAVRHSGRSGTAERREIHAAVCVTAISAGRAGRARGSRSRSALGRRSRSARSRRASGVARCRHRPARCR